MTARASTLEHVCSSCKGLVLRGAAAAAPSCSSCGRVTCEACELGGLCVACVERLWAPRDFVDFDACVLVVVGGSSLPGRRSEHAMQLFDGEGR